MLEATEYDDSFEYNRRRDFTVSEITNDVPLADADLIAAIQDVELSVDEMKAMMQNADDQRAPLTDLTNASYAEAANTTVELVSAAGNTNGVIIRRADLLSSGTNGSHLLADGDRIGLPNGTASSFGSAGTSAENIRIKSGVKVDITSNHSNYPGSVWYEVL